MVRKLVPLTFPHQNSVSLTYGPLEKANAELMARNRIKKTRQTLIILEDL